jgi:hypothetical protein
VAWIFLLVLFFEWGMLKSAFKKHVSASVTLVIMLLQRSPDIDNPVVLNFITKIVGLFCFAARDAASVLCGLLVLLFTPSLFVKTRSNHQFFLHLLTSEFTTSIASTPH